MENTNQGFILFRRFALRIRPKVVQNDDNGYVLTTESGGMMGSLNGATSILRNWIHFNNLSNLKVNNLSNHTSKTLSQ